MDQMDQMDQMEGVEIAGAGWMPIALGFSLCYWVDRKSVTIRVD